MRVTYRILIICNSYSDQLVRRTFAAFYGTSTTDSFRKQMKENRKIEEMILMFATTATGVLKRDPSLAGDTWKLELNKHISAFVRLLREALRNVGHVSPELTARLDMYAAKLAPSPSPTDSGYDTGSTTSRRNDSISSNTGLGLSMNVMDMELVRIVAALFGYQLQDVQREVYQLKHFCTEKAAMTDLKVWNPHGLLITSSNSTSDLLNKYHVWRIIPGSPRRFRV